MAQVCSTCSRLNPAEAAYCYHDGASLGTGPRAGADPGVLSFPFPFVFPSGQSCKTFDQLGLACLGDWKTALELLEQGDMAAFLGSLGRADLALAAREGARFPDRDRGLDQFLARLPTRAIHPPKLKIEPSEINLGLLQVGKDISWELHLANLGMRLLYGSVACDDCLWLALGDSPGVQEKHFQFSHEHIIPVRVRGQYLRAGTKALEGRLVIESNGGNFTVVVRAEVPVKPFVGGVLAGARAPRQVAEKAKAAPKQAASLFENGAVAQWYRDNGWTYPVQGPAASGLGAVQQFFEALGLTAPPPVEISEKYLNFHGRPGEPLRHDLKVMAQEKRPVYAYAVSNQPWLEVGRVQLDGRVASIPLVVPAIPDRPGEILQAEVTVTANGLQRFVIPVLLAVAGRRRSGWGASSSEPVHVLPATSAGWGGESTDKVNEPVLVAIPVAELVDAKLEPRDLGSEDSSAPRHGKSWLHLLPVAFLTLSLLGTFARDMLTKGSSFLGIDNPNPQQRIALHFHDREERVWLSVGGSLKPDGDNHGGPAQEAIWDPSMRFGLVMPNEKDPIDSSKPKRLTFDEAGRTNNTCMRIDGNEWLFGERPWRYLSNGKLTADWPGQWENRDSPLGRGADGKERLGRKSIWVYPKQGIHITQTVELVPGDQTGDLDTCLVRYLIENRDRRAHQVGIRFLLDTYIGGNDGVPFLIPTMKQLCDSSLDFKTPDTVPDFIQALEMEDLAHPGTIAHLQLKLGGTLEPPDRVTLGAWPNPLLADRDRRCRQEKTLWEVPVLPIGSLDPKDSAVTIYWNPKALGPGQRREVGFTYGLGTMSASGSKLGVTVGGPFAPGGEFTVTAYVNDPSPGQSVILNLPSGFQLKGGAAEQPVPPVPPGAATRNSPVTWRVKAPAKEGRYSLKVQTNTGAAQTTTVTIRASRIFD